MAKTIYNIKENNIGDLILNLKSLTSINTTAKMIFNKDEDSLILYVLTNETNTKSSKFIIKKFSDYFEFVKTDSENTSKPLDYIIYNVNNLCDNLMMFKDYKLPVRLTILDEYIEELDINVVKGIDIKNDKLNINLAGGNHKKIESLSVDRIQQIIFEMYPLFEFTVNKVDYSNIIKLITKNQKSPKITIVNKDTNIYIKSKGGGNFNMKFPVENEINLPETEHHLETNFIRNEKIDYNDVIFKIFEHFVILQFNDTYLFLGKSISADE